MDFPGTVPSRVRGERFEPPRPRLLPLKDAVRIPLEIELGEVVGVALRVGRK